jgi:hypothetical protein
MHYFYHEAAYNEIHRWPARLMSAWVGLALCTSLWSQSTPVKTGPPMAKAKADWPPQGPTPRAADGHPDLSGAWEPNAFRQNVDLVKTGVEVPFQPWAEKLYREHKDNMSKDDPEGHCLPPGVPRVSTTPYPFRIIQTPNLTIIV